MQIIIPMSGFGERFRQAGYQVPKPLIEVNGKPIIAYVIEMFPEESNFVFICNKDHLANPNFRLKEILQNYAPTGKIIAIEPHKLGPVYAVQQAYAEIDETEPAIVNYCDFTCDWNYAHFKKWLDDVDCDGCIPAYRGFHPHSLGSTFYAYMRESNLWLDDIQEKKPFTDEPKNEFASSGTYYFRNGALLKQYFDRTVAEKWLVNREYYVSMVYKPMLADKKSIAVYELNHFMQWGTPQDLQEYLTWSNVFSKLLTDHDDAKEYPGTLMIPLAGAGSRYQKEGYQLPKPLIPVSGKPMLIQAANDLPKMQQQLFVLRHDLAKVDTIEQEIKQFYPTANNHYLTALTDGQARTCLLALEQVDLQQPLVIGACDNGVLYDRQTYQQLMADDSVDVIVWGVRAYPYAQKQPQMYGWIETEENSLQIKSVSVKKPLNNPQQDPVVIGTFTFKKADYFKQAADRMIAQERTINNEFYVDECINDAIALGLNCQIMIVDHYICWGTPDELRTFEYWQNCFHGWSHHPYKLKQDHRVNPTAISALENQNSNNTASKSKTTAEMT